MVWELWEKVGSNKNIGEINHIIFRTTTDYENMINEEPVRISANWYINDADFTYVGKLKGEYQKSYIGLIINPNGIIELMKGDKYSVNYPSY